MRSLRQWQEATQKHTHEHGSSVLSAVCDAIMGVPLDVFVPDEPVVVVVAPGRDRIFMGHTDFPGLGGFTINAATQECIVAVVQCSQDGLFHFYNSSASFPSGSVGIQELMVGRPEPGRVFWNPDDWHSYCKAALAYLLNVSCPSLGQRCAEGGKGINAFFSSSGSLALHWCVGMASSSALTTALSVGINALLDLGLTLQQLSQVDFGEYYLGKKAGAADKAAQLFAQEGQVAVIGSFPEEFLRTVALPNSLTVFMANTNIPRLSTSEALPWLCQHMCIPRETATLIQEWAKRTMQLSYVPATEMIVSGLSNIDQTAKVGLSQTQVEVILTALRRHEKPLLCSLLQDDRQQYVQSGEARSQMFSTIYSLLQLIPEEQITFRQIALYGLSEIERGLQYLSALEHNNLPEVLHLVSLSHDGDRALIDYRKSFAPTPWATSPRVDVKPTDTVLKQWLTSGANLAYQVGAFQRSIPDIDEAASQLSADFPNIAAMRVAAAGMGGNVAVYTLTSHASSVRDWLEHKGWCVRRICPGPPSRLYDFSALDGH
ncbi:hypothetical protein Pelo_14400 [Pelomyxa schiedti]|nr:hypothetical protein Pelo_14400 [Pelomyxa schiedti]